MYWQLFVLALKRAVLHKDSFMVLALASAFYLVFYSWPYQEQIITNVPTYIIDQDQSEASREFISALDASPAVNIVGIDSDMNLGRQAQQEHRADVLVVIPDNYETHRIQAEPSTISVFANGAYPVKGRAVGSVVMLLAASDNVRLTALHTLADGLDPAAMKTLLAKGPSMVSQDLFNPINGYGLYTVSIVCVVIIQSVMFFGIGISMGRWLKQGMNEPVIRQAGNTKGLLMIITAFWTIALFWTFFMEGIGFWAYEMPSLVSAAPALLAMLLFTLSACLVGLLLALLFKDNHYTAPTVVLASAPSVFVSGLVFPLHEAPWWVHAIASLIPSTPGAKAIVAASQQGAQLLQIAQPLGLLALQILLYGTLVIVLYRRYRQSKMHNYVAKKSGKCR